MVQKSRSKEFWHIAKRGNLHQTICLIESIINRTYDNSSWKATKQNNVGNDLRKRGATRSGRTVSNQSIRTLVASMPQYFGFLFIDPYTTPNTIKLTKVGHQLYNAHKDQLENGNKLSDLKKEDNLIESSLVFRKQFEKLQITNPIILKSCNDIMVFPFRMTLKLLLELDYLDREEIAYFLFNTRDQSEYKLTLEKIKNFRRKTYLQRKKEIKLFSETHLGNISLVQAPTASYFESNCETTGIIDKIKIPVPNKGSNEEELNAIKIKDKYLDYVENILNTKYSEIETYDFEDNIYLWIEYIGNPNRIAPPKTIKAINNGEKEFILTIYDENSKLIAGDFLLPDSSIDFPAFLNEKYKIEIINPTDGQIELVLDKKISKTDEIMKLKLEGKKTNNFTFDNVSKEIMNHSKSKNFSKKTLEYLKIIENITGQNLTNNKYFRGAYYEYFFYQLLNILSELGHIDDVYWNGNLGQFGIPRAAPGGKIGTPDIVFIINKQHFVLELTTIKSKSMQFNKEGSSIPGHIENHSDINNNNPIGIFCAPKMHKRNINSIKATTQLDDNVVIFLKDKDLIEILSLQNKDEIYSKLISKLN